MLIKFDKKLAKKIADEYKVKIIYIKKGDAYCKANGINTYIDNSFVIGKSDVQIGIYKNEELKMASFFHEIGHTIIPENFAESVNYHTRAIELQAWIKGLELAEQHNIKFNSSTYKWIFKCVTSYRK